ncbi:MAG: DNA repair protein RadC [Verrucomicrobiaceae bacterium]|nr:MAG: DNA repair protein RadC [Verrucomicrobiaceae bacterium]
MKVQCLEADSLFVRSAKRRYEQASAEAIVAAARSIIARRMQRGASFLDPSAARSHFLDKLAGYEREVFAVLFLDTRHRLIEYAELFLGTIDGAEVHPREVVRHALQCNAAALIVAHNHPSGVAEPSAADRAVTARLKQALALVDIRLLDHIVIGENCSTSMASAGMI